MNIDIKEDVEMKARKSHDKERTSLKMRSKRWKRRGKDKEQEHEDGWRKEDVERRSKEKNKDLETEKQKRGGNK